jgi:molybdopterin molybdotransferase
VNIKKEDGIYYATPKFGKSGMITNLSKADGYVVLKIQEEGVNKGDLREVYLL